MAHADAVRRIGRPTRTVLVQDFVRTPEGAELLWDAAGNPVMVEHVEEYGRRAGLHTRKSQTSRYRREANRRERQGVRRQLRVDPDLVSATPRKNDSIWLTR